MTLTVIRVLDSQDCCIQFFFLNEISSGEIWIFSSKLVLSFIYFLLSFYAYFFLYLLILFLYLLILLHSDHHGQGMARMIAKRD